MSERDDLNDQGHREPIRPIPKVIFREPAADPKAVK